MAFRQERKEALESAFGRLPMAVVVVEGDQTLHPLNSRAVELFEREGLRGDLVSARPSHPLSTFVVRLMGSSDGAERLTIAFPSGNRFDVDASRRSEKGSDRLLVLLIEPHRQRAVDEEAFRAWDLTPRERQVVQMMVDGASSAEICKALGLAGNTLKTHVKSALMKTGTRTRAELVARILRT
ncbi:MAG TPA: helix-turn-helix transcriptional regulator [Thermoanaerobaculia bacterium]|nr:helix-turn-helix transcriptional regulator [Thermoanaerobaculia bacterium]